MKILSHRHSMPANEEQSNQLITHVETNLGEMYIRRSGKGVPMIFWPSLMMDGTMWDAQANYFKDRYTVVCVDSPGHGRSQPLTSTFTMEDCARCLKTIMDTLNLEKAILIGNSWGGNVGRRVCRSLSGKDYRHRIDELHGFKRTVTAKNRVYTDDLY